MYLLFLLVSLSMAAPTPNAEFQTDTITIDVDGSSLPVGYTLRAPPGKKFDPSQPTVVYVNGGPNPLAENPPHNVPKIFPNNIQVIIVDYIGTSRNDENFPMLNSEQILAHLNASGQAGAIRDVIKKVKLENYILWGASLGVSVSLRTVNAIQKDHAIKAKPVAVVLDSGSGRPITQADLLSPKCKPQRHQTPSEKQKCSLPQGIDPNTLSSYLSHCYPDGLSPERQSMLSNRLARYHFPKDPKSIERVLGCPPVKKIDYGVWSYSMACGEFDAEAAKSTLNYCNEKCGYPVCDKAQEDCKKSCTSLPKCQESPIDVKKMNLSKTAVLGIQAQDDCTSRPAAMDYLMSNLSVPNYYLSVPKGGHVSYQPSSRDNDLWQACHDNPDPIFSNLFKGQVDEVGKIMRSCYTGDAQKEDKPVSAVR
jgi:pimeloyl-ACP methyl ester carboxylesterase